MPRPRGIRPGGSPADTSSAVDAFIRTLAEPVRTEAEHLRSAILESDSSIRDGVKWNAPSYRTTEYFATTNLRTKSGLGLVLHGGAKVRRIAASRETIDDPDTLLTWVASDRATIAFANVQDIDAKRAALQAIIRQWIAQV